MFISDAGGTGYIFPSQKGLGAVTLALTNPSGSVEIKQMGPEVADPTTQTWFPYVRNGNTITLDAGNTMTALYSPVKLQIIATGTGVRKYSNKG